MKRALIFILLILNTGRAWSQDYVALGDSCYNVKNYREAAQNYDLFLLKVESRSNRIAYQSAKSWAMARELEKTITSVEKYVVNNYLNNYYTFSDQLLKEDAFQFVNNDDRWKKIIANVQQKEALYKKNERLKIDSMVAYQAKLEKQGLTSRVKFDGATGKQVYQQIRNFNSYPKIESKLISMQFKITATLHNSFSIVLPENYNEKNKYPLLFFLHGAVRMNTGYAEYSDKNDTTGWNRYYTKYANLHQVIMVYPNGNREYNWMFPDKGFYMVPAILQQIKKIVNVDDNKVFISGHSNGATGSFSYAVKQPSAFAGFYGFNTRPQVATGGTFLRNLLNRSYFNVSTDEDYYYPPLANDSLTYLMNKLGADYQDHRYKGFPHWFPAFNDSEPAHKLLFDDLVKRTRNPFKATIQWECDDDKYGRCDWLQITALDTAANAKPWQAPLNFKINKWIVLDKEDEAVVKDTLLNAYTYKKRSGAIKAEFKSNRYQIESSRVKSIKIYISPEMVDMQKEIIVQWNGVIRFKGKIDFNKNFLISDFEKNVDRAAVWANYITLSL